MAATPRLRVKSFVDGMFGENCYLLWAAGGADAWIIDPGFPPTPSELAAALREEGLAPREIVLTHGHVDHIAGIAPLRQMYPAVRIIAPAGEEHMLTDAQANLSAPYGTPITAPPADALVRPGDVREMAGFSWRVLDVAGHSPAGVAYYCDALELAFSGDALFAGSIGRTDFPGSSHERLLRNIREQLLTLPPDTRILSGHGPATTVGEERASNPYVGMAAWDAR